ncbi:MAG: methyltransferase domain-containing protein [Planctomycetes bacterium]|nr:methyltransferase domain-containing protein [Planctomycetota bacterium]
MSELRVDIGCGGYKREGFPFPDGSVDAYFSSHFFEHVRDPTPILREIIRTGREGAKVEIWVPHARNNIGFLMGHVNYYTETQWEHFFILYPHLWFTGIAGMLRWDELHYVIRPGQYGERERGGGGGMPLPFAIRHLNNVVLEFKVVLTVLKGDQYSDKNGMRDRVQYPQCFWGYNREDRRALDAPYRFWSVDS